MTSVKTQLKTARRNFRIAVGKQQPGNLAKYKIATASINYLANGRAAIEKSEPGYNTDGDLSTVVQYDDKMLIRTKAVRGKSAKTKRLGRQLQMAQALCKEFLSKDVEEYRDKKQPNVENIGKPEEQMDAEESREQNEGGGEEEGEEEGDEEGGEEDLDKEFDDHQAKWIECLRSYRTRMIRCATGPVKTGTHSP